ncbi:MAG: cupin domain-containing protein [Pseudolabrys sp.]
MAAGEPLTFHFADDGLIPNNPKLPMLFYKGGIDLAGVADPADRIETVFAANGWGRGAWRNGIFPFVHYHSMIHEVLAIARGRASVQFGGPNGTTVEVAPGDVALLPAGTGHRLNSSDDLLVIGSYPPSGDYNLCRGSKAEHDQAAITIPLVPLPHSDPVFGADGPLSWRWRVR